MKKKYVMKEFKSEKEIDDIIYSCRNEGKRCIGFNMEMIKILQRNHDTLKLWRIDGNMNSCKVGELYYNKITRSIDYEWTWCSEWFDDSYKIDPISEELFTI